MSARKVLVERPVYESFVNRLVKRAASLPVGDPAADGTVVIRPHDNATEWQHLDADRDIGGVRRHQGGDPTLMWKMLDELVREP